MSNDVPELTGCQLAFVGYMASIGYPIKPNFVSRSCRLCGGRLFVVEGMPREISLISDVPTHYKAEDTPTKDWYREDMVRNRSSAYLCPACVWQYHAFVNSSFRHVIQKLSFVTEKFAPWYLFNRHTLLKLPSGKEVFDAVDDIEPPFVVLGRIGKSGSNRPFNMVMLRTTVGYDSKFFPATVIHERNPLGETIYVDRISLAKVEDKSQIRSGSQLYKAANLFL